MSSVCVGTECLGAGNAMMFFVQKVDIAAVGRGGEEKAEADEQKWEIEGGGYGSNGKGGREIKN